MTHRPGHPADPVARTRPRGPSCWRPRAATAPASTARWSRSRRPSTCTAPRSTCASRSCTTSTWWPTWSPAAPIFVEELDEVPEGRTVVFSAHGVSPEVHSQAAARSLKTIDATCPLVTKVHHEARRFADDDYDILLIGHEGHEEVEGTAGEAPEPHPARAGPRGRRRHRRPRPGQGRLALPDHALGGRDDGDRRRDPRAVPAAARPAQRRHLLRHPEPPARGQGDRARTPTW